MNSNAFENAIAQLARATAVQPFDENLLVRLREPEREITVHIPVRMDDGTTRVFEGYRVQYSSVRGPYKGGIRYHAATDTNEVRALAFWMTLKTAVAGIPMGGGKGGVTVNPKNLSKEELERLSRGWVRLLAPVLGAKIDVPAPDVNTTPEIMGWMVDEYAKLTGDSSGAAFTGKALDKGGSEGRSAATGVGGYLVFAALRELLGIASSGTVAVQGMGNVGSHVAEVFRAHGYVVHAISDSKSGVFSEEGIDLAAVTAYKKEHGNLAGFPDAQAITNEELLELPVDILIPAALENQLTGDNASAVRAKVILELANGPTTPEADDIFFERGIPVIPDVLANSGGVIVSMFEWQQNLAGEHWSAEGVEQKLEEILKREATQVGKRSLALETDLRRAAFVIALERIVSAMH